ncbi:basic helix-loop-helix domain-containing protein USF3 [Discoglossus pictus]
MPEMTQSDTSNMSRKKNRESHNEVERHRKKKINVGINRIGDLIPCSPALKQSKNMILEQAFKYITELKRQNDELLLNGGDPEQAGEIKKLRKELEEIQKENARYIELLKSNDICLYDDPTLHWKRNSKIKNFSVVATNQVQKTPLTINGGQLASTNQSATMHGITFNVGHNLQKQTANVVPVQRTCNLVTPVTISGVFPLEDKTWQQSVVSASTSSQQTPLCLPITSLAPSTIDIPRTTGDHNVPCTVSSSSPFSILDGSTSQSSQENTMENRERLSNSVSKTAVSSCTSIPSSLCPLVSEVPQVCVSGVSLQESPSRCRRRLSGGTSCAEAVRHVVQEIFPSINIDSSPEVTVSAREVVTSAVEMQVATNVTTFPNALFESSLFLSTPLPASDQKSVLTRIPSDGNTQTTWTTLQLAGNTVQPVSQSSSTAIPMLLTEQQGCSKDVFNSRPTATCINLNNIVPSEVKPIDQVIVKMPSCQNVPLPSVISQQPAANILPLHPPVQVIQVAQPIGTPLNSTPANQNIIVLQPPNPAPCPPVLRTELPKPTVGQQIVIIQAAPNQNPVPLISAQPTPSVMLPLNSANPVVCPTNTVINVAAPQTFGGKHLVHILPRPAPLPASSTTQATSVSSTTTSSQQPPTISLNGQLFALQPMTPSAGSSNQTPMQIIQPTTSEDPNTNVALNTFGALANLSQSISQMAGQSCLQFTLNPPANNNIAVNCASVTAKNMSPATTESSPVLSIASKPTNTVSAKSAGGSPSSVKQKKTTKKSSARKLTSKRDSPNSSNKMDKLDSMCIDGVQQSSGEVQYQSEPVSNSMSQETSSVLDGTSQEVQNNDPIHETNTSATVSGGTEANILLDAVAEEQFSADLSNSRKPVSSTEVCITDIEQESSSVAQEELKTYVVTSTTSLPLTDAPTDDSAEETGINSNDRTETISVSEPCEIQENSTSLTATDLLEVQILSDVAKEKSSSEKVSLAGPEQYYGKEKFKEPTSADPQKPDAMLMNHEVDHGVQQPTCVSEQEVVVTSSFVTSRQTDSPMSTSSGSSRNFSVASMLPDTSRETVTNNTPSVASVNGCSFPEQNDIVAIAARSIFDHENLPKGRSKVQTDAGCIVSGAAESDILGTGCRHSFIPQSIKESLVVQVPSSSSFNSLDSNELPPNNRLVEKNNFQVGISATNLSLQISTSQSQNMTSLSINNLIHQGNVNCADVSQTSTQITLSTSANQSVSSSTYENQSQGSTILSEYSQEQLHSMRTTVMHANRGTESILKQSDDSRKDAKRQANDDVLLSTAKRQKLCQAPIRMQPPDNLTEQNEILSHVPSNSSSVSGSNQGHGDGLVNLFPLTNSFVNSNMRQPDMRCNSQPSISEQQQGQMGSQHLQSLQQHAPSQQVSLLHSNSPYLKQQQQVSHVREHHLYQQQQLHVSHAESSIHQQSHNIPPQRLMQQDVQMQKKRGPVQSSQSARLTMQQKHHLSEQNRQKGSQPHAHHQQIQQQMPPHFGSSQAEKSCENRANSRSHHGTHTQSHINPDMLHQQDVGSRQQGTVVSSEHLSGHNQVQRLMTSRSLEQQMVSQPSVVSRSANMTCAPHRQERNRVSSYSAEALIGKSTSNSEQRMGISVQGSRVSEHLEMRKYLDVSRNKGLPIHTMHGRLGIDHSVSNDNQRLSDCQTYKHGGSNQQQPGTFDIQTSRNNDGNTVPSMRGMQAQTYRISQNPNASMDRQKHIPYQPVQDMPIASTLPLRDNENSCHQSFMQSLLAPHIGEPVGASQRSISGHTRNAQYNSSGIEYNCPPTRDAMHLRRDSDGQNRESCDLAMGQGNSRNNSISIPFSSSSTSGDIQGRNTSPHITMQKSGLRPTESQGVKNHLNIQVSINMHGVVHPSIPHQSISHGNAEHRQTVRQTNSTVSQRSRHPLQEDADAKIRQPERNRSNNQRHGNMFDSTLPHLPLAGPGSMILGRQQPVADKRTGIVRFMPDSPQVSSDNPTSDQHTLTQNFGFPFIPEGTMNPPLNANTSFIPPVTQTAATRTPALIPVDPQNTLPSFYPSYSPAHPSLPNDITIPYFSNQMFPNPSTEKPNSSGLNNRFGSILSPPRPVGFTQTTFPLLSEMPPMHMTNPSHLSNFNLTSLFPEIATALPADGSAMSPLLSISHSSTSDSSKQSSNRPAHNISHILGHDSSSAV